MSGTPGRVPVPVMERLLARIEIRCPSETVDSWALESADGACWIWQGPRTVSGYGVLAVGSKLDGSDKNQYVHRVSYEAIIGPIPDGLQLYRLCGNAACCNPDHAEVVTPRANMLRGTSPAGVNAARWACIAGHAFDSSNTLVRKDGSRACRACANERARRHRQGLKVKT